MLASMTSALPGIPFLLAGCPSDSLVLLDQLVFGGAPGSDHFVQVLRRGERPGRNDRFLERHRRRVDRGVQGNPTGSPREETGCQVRRSSSMPTFSCERSWGRRVREIIETSAGQVSFFVPEV